MAKNEIQIAAKLYECRDAARSLSRGNYGRTAIEWMKTVKAIADGLELDYMHAGMKIAEDVSHDGGAMMWVFAATVELIEPDELTPAIERAEAAK